MKYPLFVILSSLLFFPLLAQEEKGRSALSALRNGDNEGAIRGFSGDLTELAARIEGVEEDELRLHQARAHQRAGKNEEAVKLCDEFLQAFPESVWRHKVSFVKAQALAGQRKFEAALAIYQNGAAQVFGKERQDFVAGKLITFAELFARVPAGDDLDAAPADYAKALILFRQVLDMDCSDEVREKVKGRIVILSALSQDWKSAEVEALAYLQEFDPTWRGPFGSVTRLTTAQNTQIRLKGAERFRMRYHHAEALHRQNRRPEAVRYLLELDDLMKGREDLKALRGDAHWLRLMAMTHRGAIAEVDLWVKEARSFLAAYPNHLWSSQIASSIASAYEAAKRWEEARLAYQEFLDGKGYLAAVADPLTLDEKSAANFEHRKRRHAERLEKASFSIGEIFLKEKKFDEASAQWSKTAQNFPNGEKWADCQKGLVEVAFQKALQSVRSVHRAEKANQAAMREAARGALGEFLAQYPLDQRLPQLMFALGELSYYEGSAVEVGEEFTLNPAREVAFEKAIADWRRLVSKYPKSPQAQAAELKIGSIYENYLGDLEKALEIYRGLKNGQSQKSLLLAKSLVASSSRVFGTDENPEITLKLRNVESVKVRQYWIDFESFFRKSLDLSRIEELDVDLVEPDKIWEVKIPNYQRYLPMTHQLAIPFEKGKPGVCVIKVEGEELESTTVAVRSDIDVAIRSSRGESLLFVRDWKSGKLASGVKLVLAEGSKVIASGVTGEDGVWRYVNESLSEVDQLRVLAISKRGMAGHSLSIAGTRVPEIMEPRASLTTVREIHRPGETVNLKVVLRDVQDRGLKVPVEKEREFSLEIRSQSGRLLMVKEVFLNEFGAALVPFVLPEDLQGSLVKLSLGGVIGGEERSFLGQVLLSHEGLPWTKLSLDFEKKNVALGELAQGKVSAKYRWGAALAQRKVILKLPGGLTRDLLTDAKGEATFEYPTKDLGYGQFRFAVSIPSSDSGEVVKFLKVAKRDHVVSAKLSDSLVISGDPFHLNLKAQTFEKEAIARKLSVILERPLMAVADPVLMNVPGLNWSQEYFAKREKVLAVEVETDAKNGEVKVPLKLSEGGAYFYRVFDGDQEVAEGSLTISDDKDSTKLRLFTKGEKLSEGMTAVFRLHSRFRDETPVLMTVERDQILEYRVIQAQAGFNEISIPLSELHRPDFYLHVMALDERRLHEARIFSQVTGELKVELEVEGELESLGGKVKVKLSVKDMAGQPVKAETTLAIVRKSDHPVMASGFLARSSALLPEPHKFASCSSCGFQHQGKQSLVNMEIQNELNRQLAENDLNLSGGRLLPVPMPHARGSQLAIQERVRRDMPDSAIYRWAPVQGDQRWSPRVAGGGARIEGSEDYRSLSVISDAEGVAVIEMSLPEEADDWVLLGEALTMNGRAGGVQKEIELREELSVHLALPLELFEGDSFMPKAIVSRADVEQVAEGLLKFTDAKGLLSEKKIRFEKGQASIEVFFGELQAELGKMAFVAEVVVGSLHKKVEASLQPSPWGAPVMARAGVLAGVGKTRFKVVLAKDAEPTSLSLLPQASVSQSLRLLAASRLAPILHLRGPLMRQHPAGELLAQVTLAQYGRKRGFSEGELALMMRQIESLVSELTVRQREDGGWSAHRGRKASDLTYSTASYEGLLKAKSLGLKVDEVALQKVQDFLKGRIGKASANERALIQQSLASGGAGDFSACNRLYRTRAELSAAGQVNLAMAFIHLKRPEFTKVLLENLGKIEAKDVVTLGRALQAWAALDVNAAQALALEKELWGNCGSFGFSSDLARGFGIMGLASLYEMREAVAEDFRATIFVNGTEVGQIESGQEEELAPIFVDRELLQQGENEILVSLEGRGFLRVGATATGLREKFPDQNWARDLRVTSRSFYHPGQTYRGVPLNHQGASPATKVEVGERVRVRLNIRHYLKDHEEIVICEKIPAGFDYLKGSLSGRHSGAHVENGYLIITHSGRVAGSKSFDYELVAKTPGQWRLLPTAIFPIKHVDQANYGPLGQLTVLPRGEKSDDPYLFQSVERYELASLLFQDGDLAGASEQLAFVRKKFPEYHRAEVARMILWIETEAEQQDARLVADSFEVLNELSPELEIPFDKILKVGEAYRELNEFERGMDVFLATLEAGFANEAFVGAAIEDQGRFLDALDYQEELWRRFPDYGEISNAWFGLAQQVYQKAAEAKGLSPRKGETETPTPRALYLKSVEMLERFRATEAHHPLADDGAFTIANTLFKLKSYEAMVSHAKASRAAYPESDFVEAFQYLGALGNFWQRKYDQAFRTAKVVAEGSGKDKNLSAYICAQILHAQGKTVDALKWYEKVKGEYPDARDSIAWFEQKKIEFDEIKVIRSGEAAELVLQHRNIDKADLQIYRVDLMKFYLREKNLSKISQVNLAGIAPKHEMSVDLKGDQFSDLETKVVLPVEKDGAYLIICRGDYLYSSGLVLVTPLKMETQENAGEGSVRVNMIDRSSGKLLDGVHVKAIGSSSEKLVSGDTDLRGVWKAEGITGKATVIARDQEGRYAFYRGTTSLGIAAAPNEDSPLILRERQILGKDSYNGNNYLRQDAINSSNVYDYEQFRRSNGKGVKVNKAIKK